MEGGLEISREEQVLFDRAAAETWLRIRHDQARSSPRVKDMLRYLSECLYDTTLDVARWKSFCSIRGNSIEQRFQEDLGYSPYHYLTSMRLDTAARLLVKPHPNLSKIAELVGYKSLTVFSRAFLREMGMRPTRYRALVCSSAPVPGRRARIAPWRQVLLARTDAAAILRSLRRFTDHYPQRAQKAVDGGLPQWRLGSERFEQRKAERIWAGIRRRSHLEQVTLVRLQADFQTGALFNLLREKSREEGRRDRHRGLEIAELGLLSLDLCAEALADDLPIREAEGWISVANARRLILDFIGSDREFEIAEGLLRIAKRRDPLIEAKLAFYRACLRWFQMSYDSALELANKAVELSRRFDGQELLAKSLILRTTLNKNLGDTSSLIEDIQESLNLIDVERNPYLAACAYTTLATSQLQLGHDAQATMALDVAKQLFEKFQCRSASFQIYWLDGLVLTARGKYSEAEDSLLKALDLCSSLGEREYGAVIALDFAILKIRQGKESEALSLARQAVPVLEAVRVDREALSALKILEGAVAAHKLSIDILKEVRDFAERLIRNPLCLIAKQKREKRGRVCTRPR